MPPQIPFRLAVLNPGGGDLFQDFASGYEPAEGVHPPVNFHAYAACCGGAFHRSLKTIPGEQRAVLLLLRRDLRLCLKTLRALKARGAVVAVSLKETGVHQLAALLANERSFHDFSELCAEADFALAPVPSLVSFYRGAGVRRVEVLPTPYPVEAASWDFTSKEERAGVFIGTREFGVPTRRHLEALLAARRLREPLTVVNGERRAGGRMLREIARLGGEWRVVEGRLPYRKWLELIAGHRLVFQLDHSGVPGQVAGDALLARVPCVGGDGAVERIAFPTLCGHGREPEVLLEKAAALLSEESLYAAAVEASQRLARERLSFSVAARALAAMFE